MNEQNNKARILIITREKYPTNRVDVVVLFSKYLKEILDISWLMQKEVGSNDKLIEIDGEKFHLYNAGLAGKFKAHFSAIRRIARGDYDVVQCRDEIIISALYAFASKIFRVPFVYWMSYPMDEGYLEIARSYFRNKRYIQGFPRWLIGTVGRWLLLRFTLPIATHIFVQSEMMRQEIMGAGISGTKITSVPMGVDTETYSMEKCLPADDPFYAGRRSVVYLGALGPVRQMHVPAAGVAKALRSTPDTVFVVIGGATAADRDVIAREFEDIPSQLIMLDRMPLADALRHVRRADVCISPVPDIPILRVGTPTKLVEYLAMGSRVVANRHPDQVQVISGAGSGILCDFDANDFSRATKIALAQGRPSAKESSVAIQWIKNNRDYRVLSTQVGEIYARLTA